jgi:hypothetical protein
VGSSPARVALLAGLLAIVGTLTSCSSTGTHTQSPSPSTSGSNTSSGGTTSSSKPPSPPTSTDPLPTNFGDAQAAVTAFLSLDAAENAAFRDPAHVSSADMDRYLIGSAQQVFDAALFNEKRAGRAYRGTPPTQRIRVVSTNMKAEPKAVVLSSCPLAATTDPYTEYVVATGKAVPPSLTPGVPPPYGKTIKVIELSGQWRVSTFTTDGSKTCKP